MNSNEKEINGMEIDEQTTPAETIEEEVVEEAAEAIEEEVIAEEVTKTAEDVEEAAGEADTEVRVTFETPDDVETVGEVYDEEALEESEAEIVEEEAFETLVADEVSKKKGNTAVIIGIVAVLAVVVTVVILFFTGVIGGNKYNKLGYPNVSGRTIDDIAAGAEMEVKDFLEMYDLPEDMPGDTEEMNALYYMPASMYLETMYGIDFATMKAALNIPDQTTPNTPKTVFDKIKAIFVKDEIQEINEKTPWYIVEGELTVGDFSGGKLDEFKEFYGLGDEVTEETKIKEINDEINESIKQKLKEQEEAAALEQTETENEEAPAQDTETSAEAEQTENAAQSAETENSEDKSEE